MRTSTSKGFSLFLSLSRQGRQRDKDAALWRCERPARHQSSMWLIFFHLINVLMEATVPGKKRSFVRLLLVVQYSRTCWASPVRDNEKRTKRILLYLTLRTPGAANGAQVFLGGGGRVKEPFWCPRAWLLAWWACPCAGGGRRGWGDEAFGHPLLWCRFHG